MNIQLSLNKYINWDQCEQLKQRGPRSKANSGRHLPPFKRIIQSIVLALIFVCYLCKTDGCEEYGRILVVFKLLFSIIFVIRHYMTDQGYTGKRIENYVYNYADFIGNGNFSKCYKAVNTKTKQEVAIKIVQLNSLKSKKLEELLYSEIEVLKEMDHPNVLHCLEVFNSNRNCYIITQLCNEGDLESKIKKSRLLTQQEIRHIVADVYNGLSYLASKTIIHRDLKIANIFLKNGVAKIADFGFAVHSRNTFRDLNIGSPLYMSPEGIHSNIYGPKTDVWAFGIMVYQLFHGKTPFHFCQTQQQLKENVLKPIQWSQLKADIPSEAKQLILSCLQIRQDKRPTIAELNSNPYIQLALMTRQSAENESPKFRYPFRQNQPLQIYQQEQRSKSINKITSLHNTSRQNFKIDIRAITPQKAMFHPQNAANHNFNNFSYTHHGHNNRMQNLSLNGGEDTHKTADNFFRSPQHRHTNISHSANTSLNFQPIKSPITLADESIKYQHSQNNSTKSPIIVNGQISFKQSVSLLHYCRLIFKYLQEYKKLSELSKLSDKTHYATLGYFLVLILDQIYIEIKAKKIRYEGDNSEIRESKLNEVIDEYKKKYNKELDKSIINGTLTQKQKKEINMDKIREIAESFSFLSSIPQKCTNEQAIVAQLLLTIYSSTLLLQECYSNKNYHSFHKSKQIEEILTKTKQNFTYSSYSKHKNKIMNLKTASMR